MNIDDIELTVSEDVAGSTEVSHSYVPEDGSTIWVEEFVGDGAFQPNAVIRLEWDGDILWTIKGSSKIPFKKKITDTDGVKSLDLICDNGETGALYLSGYARIAVCACD